MTHRTRLDPDAALEINARGHRHDPTMERAADLFHTDRDAWNRLPQSIRGASDIYADMRDYYRAAVEAGVIPDDRTPQGNPDASP